MKWFRKKLGILFCLLIFLWLHCRGTNKEADLILCNGVVYTCCDENPFVQSVAVRGKRIIATGKDDFISRFKGEETRVIDLAGRFVCPGFNDAHIHLMDGGLNVEELDLTGVTTAREIQRRVLAKIRVLEPGEWVVGRGWDQSLLSGGNLPNKRILDIISPDVPIMLKRICGHVVLVNSKALYIAGIDEKTPDPPGGQIEKDPETGEPTGILKEAAQALVRQYMPVVNDAEREEAIMRGLALAGRYGITSIQDNCTDETVYVYQKLLREGLLTCRVSVWLPIQEHMSILKKWRGRLKGDMLRFGLVKGFIDGSMGARTAALFEPYHDDPGTKGLPRMSAEQLNRMVIEADREGFQIAFHAIGDMASHMVLNAYEMAYNLNRNRPRRHRIEHAQLLKSDDISRFQALGVVASMQPVHCIEDMRWIVQRLGNRRCRYAYAWRSLQDHGAHLAFGTDWPVSSMNPMLGLYAAVTRRDTLGYPIQGWMPNERLAIEEAIKAYTRGSAYAEWMEKEKGYLAPGALADLVVLDQNIMEISSKNILKTRVEYTILGGEIVYQRR